MAKKPSSPLYPVSFRKNPRAGQAKVFSKILTTPSIKTLNVRLPTGYGKTFVALGSYSLLRHQSKVDRLLYVVPNDALREQFLQSGYQDMKDAAIKNPHQPIDVRYQGYGSVAEQRKGKHSFVITPQALLHHNNKMLITELMQTGGWMIVVDEYHHYGKDKAWSEVLLSLPCNFRLSMSAKPERPGDDDALGKPDIEVTYRQAALEGAVKPLWGHSYIYRIDLYNPETQELKTITTEELKREAIDFFRGTRYQHKTIEWKIQKCTENWRWTAKYNSPLISTPVHRAEKLRDRGYPAQVLIGATCVAHAEMLCDQVKEMFGYLRVDWVGTGPNGRSDEINKKVLKKFAPGKDIDGKVKEPDLDVLVHVGMAGEGLDSVFVTEVVHCNIANHNISNDQENGRAARMLPIMDEPIYGNINFDSTSEYAKKGYINDKIMDAMDDDEPQKTEEGEEREEPYEFIIGDDAPIFFRQCEYEKMGSDDPGFQDFINHKKIAFTKYKFDGEILEIREAKKDPKKCKELLDLYKSAKLQEAEEINSKGALLREKDRCNRYSTALRSSVIKRRVAPGVRWDKALAADVSKQINSQKFRELGKIENTVECYKKHCEWLKAQQDAIIETGELPSWAC